MHVCAHEGESTNTMHVSTKVLVITNTTMAKIIYFKLASAALISILVMEALYVSFLVLLSNKSH